ncbi:MAG: hypothetical protein ACLPXZ_26510 [Mycobacterium sp.]
MVSGHDDPSQCQVTSRGSLPPGDMPQPDVNVPTGSFTDKWYGE